VNCPFTRFPGLVSSAVAAGAVLLVASGCAGGVANHRRATSPTTIVRIDVSRIAHSIPRWHVTAMPVPPKSGRCIRRVGDPKARIARGYNYPSLGNARRQVFATVEYRAPAKSQALVAEFATPSLINCERAYAIRFYRHWIRRFPPGSRDVNVRMTAGLPNWLTGALGHRVEGYTATVRTPIERIYGLVFVYQDARNSHVVYQIAVDQIDAVPRGVALRVIDATGGGH
jgi:hypothetical protein